jgi:hypothetical protein
MNFGIELHFKIKLHNKYRKLVEKIQNYFGVGTISELLDGSTQYQVCSINTYLSLSIIFINIH